MTHLDFLGQKANTIFLLIISTETILFWIFSYVMKTWIVSSLGCGHYSRKETNCGNTVGAAKCIFLPLYTLHLFKICSHHLVLLVYNFGAKFQSINWILILDLESCRLSCLLSCIFLHLGFKLLSPDIKHNQGKFFWQFLNC